MRSAAKYRTRQRDILLEYLEDRAGEHVTAGDVCAYMTEQGMHISKATVYRQLESLVEEGTVNKYIIDANSPACFEYINHSEHIAGDTCFHCKCSKCGKLIHLHCPELERFSRHLADEHHFTMDPFRTVIYGLCEDCAGEAEHA